MVPVAIMALLTVTRHLRAAEEDGRLELVRSAPVGRDAPVVAGLVAAVVATVAVGGLTFLALLSTRARPGRLARAHGRRRHGRARVRRRLGGRVAAHRARAGRPARSAWRCSGSRSCCGRSATCAARRAPACSRGCRRSAGRRRRARTSTSGSGRSRSASSSRRVLVAVAFWLVGRRDLGTGLLAERLGRPRATARLTGMVALTLRRQLGAIVSWGVGIVVMGAFIGLLAGEIVDFVGRRAAARADVPDRPERRRGVGLRALHGVPRRHGGRVRGDRRGAARTEEIATRGAIVLSGPVSRVRWLGSQVGRRGGRCGGDHAGHRPA